MTSSFLKSQLTECEHFMNYRNSMKSSKTTLQMSEVDFVQKLCRSAKPLIEHLKNKEEFFQAHIRNLMNQELHEATGTIYHQSIDSDDSFRHRCTSSLTDSTLLDRDRDPNFVPKTRSKKSILGLAMSLISKLTTIAVESLGQYLQKKRNKVIKKALHELETRVHRKFNHLYSSEQNLLLYGKYNEATLKDVIDSIRKVANKSNMLERLLRGQHTDIITHYVDHYHRHLAYVNNLQMYLHSIKEKHIYLYKLLVRDLQKLLIYTNCL